MDTSSSVRCDDEVSTGDQIDARGSQGFVNQARSPVTQNFGPQRNVNTSGGRSVPPHHP